MNPSDIERLIREELARDPALGPEWKTPTVFIGRWMHAAFRAGQRAGADSDYELQSTDASR